MNEKFYAKDNMVSTSPIIGGIEISRYQYELANEASVTGDGRIVVKDGKFSIKPIKYKTVYRISDKTPEEILEHEDIPSGYTDLKPFDYLCVWDDEQWVLPDEVMIHREIMSLEEQITTRRLREVALGYPESIRFLKDIENKINILREKLSK